jgi:type IV secretory pathway TrbD component
MADVVTPGEIAGFEAPVHRALTEPILLAGAPRAVAILNGILSAAIGLGLRLWIAGLILWSLGHMAAVWAGGGLGRQARPAVRRGRSPACAVCRRLGGQGLGARRDRGHRDKPLQ